jgi:nicotinate phosphoribosyltransferase
LKGIRLDSGDLVKLSNDARKMLDEEGFFNTKILISNDVDEYFIEDFKKHGGKCDIWGIGTRLVTAYDEPALTGVYKLAEIDKMPKVKVSNSLEKITLPSKKKVVRFYDIKADASSILTKKMVGDVIFNDSEIKIKKEGLITGKMTYNTKLFNLHSDELDKVENIEYSGYESTLKLLFHNGKRVKPKLTWQDAQKNMELSIEQLGQEHKDYVNPDQYPILISENLSKLRTETIKKYIK